VFLDPFAGSGALVAARLRTPAHRVIYNDLHPPEPRTGLLAGLTGRGRLELHAEDALALPSLPAGTVDAIVTDPPWGEHDRDLGDYGVFAAAMSASFARVLRPATGRAVVLVTRRQETAVAAALTAASLTVLDRFPLLVNGHPAAALRAHR
jgi:23S rRNA G2445 N2-methylase RlmL